MHLRTETAADVGRYNPQLMFGNANRIGDPPAMHVRHLALQVDRQASIDIRFSQNRSRLHAGRDQAVVGNAKRYDLISLAHGLAVVTAANLVDRGDVVRHVVVELLCAVADRGFLVDNGRKCFVVDIDQPDRIVGHRLGFGYHQGDAFANETNPIDGDDRSVRHLCPRYDPVGNDRADLAREVGPRQSQTDAWRRLRRREIDLLDDGMRVR